MSCYTKKCNRCYAIYQLGVRLKNTDQDRCLLTWFRYARLTDDNLALNIYNLTLHCSSATLKSGYMLNTAERVS